jgi:uncharacterized protein (TIGR03437 family)
LQGSAELRDSNAKVVGCRFEGKNAPLPSRLVNSGGGLEDVQGFAPLPGRVWRSDTTGARNPLNTKVVFRTGKCTALNVKTRALLCLTVWSAATAMAATPVFLLGVNYSQWVMPHVAQIATDGAGSLYILSGELNAKPNVVTKLSADGKTIVWQNTPGVGMDKMAVDGNGGVYVVLAGVPGDTSRFVAKLSAGSTGFAWKTPVPGLLAGFPAIIAADSQGRTYMAGAAQLNTQFSNVVRLNAAGSAAEYSTQVTGILTSIAVDGAGAAYAAGYVASAQYGTISLLARIGSDGSPGFYTTTLPGVTDSTVVADALGNTVAVSAGIGAGGVLQRFDGTGGVIFARPLEGVTAGYTSGLAMDAAGNVYVAGFSAALAPLKNSLATCVAALDFMTVYAPDGTLLQSTYIPGAPYVLFTPARIAAGANSTLFVVSLAGPTFAPSQAGPFPAQANQTVGATFLMRLSPDPAAVVTPLGCLTNSGDFDRRSPIAPGEIISLFGSGLGPAQGVQTQASLQTPFPTKAANVQVTFDGTPGPLLWVQDAQINVVAPWTLPVGQTTDICVVNNGAKTNCLTWAVAQTAPAVFTVDDGFAAALNQDGTINSAQNPAAAGSIVSVFATGLGPITPMQGDGTAVGFPLPLNVLPVKVQGEIGAPCLCGGIGFTPVHFITPLEVTYAGPAPYLIAGASQINFRIVPNAGPKNCCCPRVRASSLRFTSQGKWTK